MRVICLENPEVPTVEISPRTRLEIIYFAEPEGRENNCYQVDLSEARRVLDEGVVRVVSPLRAENAAEVEISEDAETLLEWILEYQVIRFTVKD